MRALILTVTIAGALTSTLLTSLVLPTIYRWLDDGSSVEPVARAEDARALGEEQGAGR